MFSTSDTGHSALKLKPEFTAWTGVDSMILVTARVQILYNYY